MKAVCIVCEGARMKNDLILNDPRRSGFDFGWHFYGLSIKDCYFENCLYVYKNPGLTFGLKVFILWVWYIIILRRTHVYLVNALKDIDE